jgi:hypothetical protein
MAMAKFLLKMGYAASIEAGVNIAKEVNRFEEGEYVGIVFFATRVDKDRTRLDHDVWQPCPDNEVDPRLNPSPRE